jgi:hypothetical protein
MRRSLWKVGRQASRYIQPSVVTKGSFSHFDKFASEGTTALSDRHPLVRLPKDGWLSRTRAATEDRACASKPPTSPRSDVDRYRQQFADNTAQ